MKIKRILDISNISNVKYILGKLLVNLQTEPAHTHVIPVIDTVSP